MLLSTHFLKLNFPRIPFAYRTKIRIIYGALIAFQVTLISEDIVFPRVKVINDIHLFNNAEGR